MFNFIRFFSLASLLSLFSPPTFIPCQNSELSFRFDRLTPQGKFELRCLDSPEPEVRVSRSLSSSDEQFLESFSRWLKTKEDSRLNLERVHLAYLQGLISPVDYFRVAISIYGDLPLGLALVKSSQFAYLLNEDLLRELILEAAERNRRQLLNYYLENFPGYDLQWKLNHAMIGAVDGQQEELVKELVERGAEEFEYAIAESIKNDQAGLLSWLQKRHLLKNSR